MARNRLAEETSPYLLQHADNPVKWFPWGAEAFAEARRDEKPILLSIGYSACHWCHVMAHECFENEEIARLMNEQFVNVKVDREERPDVDELYMSCLQMMTGHGGWPMTMFLTPDGEPFYGGTYFPPEDRHGMPAFPRVLQAISEAYHHKPEAVRDTTGKLRAALEKLNAVEASGKPLDANLVDEAVREFLRAYDEQYGGLGRAPKFPNSMVFSLFLRSWDRTGDRGLLERTMTTLRSMAAGGIYDHLGGGFHRYSVDQRWLVPHFEKMLYDNALLAGLSLDTYRASGDRSFRDLAEDVLGYVKREMLAPEGGFYSTQDADTEGVEGKFFTWERGEVEEILGSDAAGIFCRVYDVSEEGNFEGRNILHRTLDDEQAARMFGRDTESMRRLLEDCRRRLFEAREKRVRPHRDEKILVSWNGLMVSAFAQATRVTGESSWLDVALQSTRFLQRNLWDGDRLFHTWKDGEARIDAFLDDYAALGLACLDLLEATFDGAWLVEAERIARIMVERFADDESGGFFLTSSSQRDLIARTRSVMDGSVPSGTSLATHLLLRLAAFTGDDRTLARAESVLRAHRDGMEANPFAYPNLLAALDLYGRRTDQVVLVAPGSDEGARALLRPLSESYLPNAVVFCYDPARPPETLPAFARDKPTVDATPTAYVCRGFTCSAPVTTWEDLQRELGSRH